jgi:hypothetical protein
MTYFIAIPGLIQTIQSSIRWPIPYTPSRTTPSIAAFRVTADELGASRRRIT